MKRFPLAIVAVALLASACSSTPAVTPTPPPAATEQPTTPNTHTQTIQNANQADYQPGKETNADWKVFTAKTLHYSFEYPSSWNLGSNPADENDPHISNLPVKDALVSGQVVVELQPFHAKDAKTTIIDLAKKDVAESAGGMGPSGSLTSTTINGHAAVRVAHAGGEGPDGPGYYIEQDSTHYTYVLVYDNHSNEMDTVNKIISSLRFQ